MIPRTRSILRKTLSLLVALVVSIGGALSVGAPKVYACYTWQVGVRVGLKGGTQIRTGPGFGYTVHTTLDSTANDWPVDIIDGPRYADGQEWWDISRVNIDGGGTGWVYIAQAGWDVCSNDPPPSSPGSIYVTSGLELQPDPNHSWPPYAGDKLIGRFTLGNDGGQSLRLEGYGVRMRRDGSDYWDFLNTSAMDLAPGQTVRFDQNNERPLVAGHYRAEITWRVSGQDWQVTDAREFDVAAPPNPGSVYVASGLELLPDPYHAWPPVAGDKLTGRFTLGNNGGQSLRLEGYGVRMRRDGSVYCDFLNNSAMDLAPGQTVRFDQNNESALAAGHYRAEITWKVYGQDWQVTDAHEFDVAAAPANPGHLELVDALSLRSDGSGQWPPQVGDKLIAHIRARNAGGQALNNRHIGVRGRRNGSENWDIGWWSVDLAPGEEWSFDPNNERQVEPGSYAFRISYSVDGVNWTEIGNEVLFLVETESPAPSPPPLPGEGGTTLVRPLSLWPSYAMAGDVVEGQFTIRNDSPEPVTFLRIGIGGRGPLGTDIHDFPWLWHVEVAPGAELTVAVQRTFSSPGPYTFFPVYQSFDGTWHEIVDVSETGGRASIIVTREAPAQGTWRADIVHEPYQDEGNRIVDVTVGAVSREVDGTFTLHDVAIESRSPLARQFRLRVNGQDIALHSWNWAVLEPWERIENAEWSNATEATEIEIITNKLGDTPASAFIVGLYNLASTVYASIQGDNFTASHGSVEAAYASMDTLFEVAEASGEPLTMVSGIVADLASGKRPLDATEKILKFNAKFPSVLPDFVEVVTGWSFTQGRVAEALGKIGSGIDWLTRFTACGRVVLAWMFETPSETRAVIRILPDVGQQSSSTQPAVGLLTPSEELSTTVIGGNWAAVQNGGSLTAATSHISLAENRKLIDSSYEMGWATRYGQDQYITVQLASARPVSLTSVTLHPGPTSMHADGASLAAFRLDSSLDGIHYSPVMTGSFTATEVGTAKSFQVSDTLAQYLRLVPLAPIDPTSPVVIVAELEAYGTPGLAGDGFEPDNLSDLSIELPANAGRMTARTFHYPGDVDWANVSAGAGRTYTLYTSNLGPNTDTVLELYDTDGTTLLASNDDSGGALASRITWTAPASGTFYARVRQYNRDRYGEGCYYDLALLDSTYSVQVPIVQR